MPLLAGHVSCTDMCFVGAYMYGGFGIVRAHGYAAKGNDSSPEEPKEEVSSSIMREYFELWHSWVHCLWARLVPRTTSCEM